MHSAKLALALLCAALALVAARQLHQTFPDLTKELEALNDRLTTAAPGKASILSVLNRYDDYEHHGHKHYGHHNHDPSRDSEGYDAPKYYYGPNKVSIKLYEKFRSSMRPQPSNPNTFQFTSELTCQNPAELKADSEHGVMNVPIPNDRMKLVTVGVCEWTVSLVKEHKVNAHATLKGNTNVVCRFSKEAEHHCPHGADVICAGMTVSGQGLVYNFESDDLQESEYKGKDVRAAASRRATPYAGKKDDDEVDSLDVYLTLINGVINKKKYMKWDNGAVQYFYGKPAEPERGARSGAAAAKKDDPTGEYTFVFKH